VADIYRWSHGFVFEVINLFRQAVKCVTAKGLACLTSVPLYIGIAFFPYVVVGACLVGEERLVYKVLLGKPEGKRPLGRPRRRWEGGFVTDFREIGWEGEEWIHLVQDRDRWRAVVNAVMNFRVPAPRS
jgi:hypothetical protein